MTDVTIGLETHVQLDTDTKLFCGCSTVQTTEPNTATCETCLGHPGSKPCTNQKAVEYALRAATALNCDITGTLRFARKTYFYPDMSKNFQITQYNTPIGENGTVPLSEEETVALQRIHLEEDPAQIKHVGGSINDADYTLLDYNRAGTPLIEIVTKPVLETPEQARQYLQTLARILQYLDVYDANRALTMKTDANISLGNGARVEVKNITGTKSIERALHYELTRQKNLAKRGRTVEQETRAYHEDQEVTLPLRTKEAEAEYGYMFEPDLPTYTIHQQQVSRIQQTLPELPHAKQERLQHEYGVTQQQAVSLVTDKMLADAFETVAKELGDFALAAQWFTGPIKKTLNYNGVTYRESTLTGETIHTVLTKLEDGEVTERGAEFVFRELVETGGDVDTIIEEEHLAATQDTETIVNTVNNVIDEHGDAVQDYMNGKEQALNFLVGKVMERSGGRIDPKQARTLLKENLG